LDHWKVDLSGQPTLDEKWMKQRLELFSRYCFPSVIAQSAKDFTWLIYFESTTPEDQLHPIRTLVSPYPFIQLRLVKGYSGCQQDIDVQLSSGTTPYVITSRLDNDDGLGLDFINMVQSGFVPRDKTLINLLHGYSYNPVTRVATRLYYIRTNHFSSYIEKHSPQGGHISVRGFPHGTPPSGTSIVDVDSKHSWLKLFHERNLLSSPFGYPLFTHRFSKHFGIAAPYLAVSLPSAFRYSFSWFIDGLNRKFFATGSARK
jgi:hypothetical protein